MAKSLRFLFNHGAKANTRTKRGKSALDLAIQSGNQEAISLIREQLEKEGQKAEVEVGTGEDYTTDSHAEINDDLFKKLSTQRLNDSELSGYSKSELRILRNSIFARHGYIFKSEDLKEYFSKFEWYKPQFSNVSHKLNSVEKENIRILKKAESQ